MNSFSTLNQSRNRKSFFKQDNFVIRCKFTLIMQQYQRPGQQQVPYAAPGSSASAPYATPGLQQQSSTKSSLVLHILKAVSLVRIQNCIF